MRFMRAFYHTPVHDFKPTIQKYRSSFPLYKPYSAWRLQMGTPPEFKLYMSFLLGCLVVNLLIHGGARLFVYLYNH